MAGTIGEELYKKRGKTNPWAALATALIIFLLGYMANSMRTSNEHLYSMHNNVSEIKIEQAKHKSALNNIDKSTSKNASVIQSLSKEVSGIKVFMYQEKKERKRTCRILEKEYGWEKIGGC